MRSARAAAASCDVVVIAAPWPEFADLPAHALEREGERLVVIDCWRLLDEGRYEGVIDVVRLGRVLPESAPAESARRR